MDREQELREIREAINAGNLTLQYLNRAREELNAASNFGGFLTFADFFFDGILADVFVQSKINDAKKQVDNAVYHIHQIMTDLYRMEANVR